MKTQLTIFQFEWKQMARSRLLLWLLVLTTASSLYAICYGNESIQRQLTNIHLLEHMNDSTRQVFQSYFKDKRVADSMRFGWVNMNTLYDGFTTEDYLENNVAIDKPNRLSHLSIGQRDVYPLYRRVTARSLYYDGNGLALDDKYAELTNPHKLLAGNFDLGFVFLYLFPLLIIALCYNLLSQEKEQGTLPLLSIQPVSVRTVISYQLLFRYLLISVLVIVYSEIGFLFSPVKEVVPASSYLTWIALLLCYMLFWFAVSFFVISLKRSSVVNALSLVGCWILIIILIPSFINNYITAHYKISSRTKFVKEVGDQIGSIWDLNDSLTLPVYYKAYPQYTTHPFKPLWTAADNTDNLGKDRDMDTRYRKKIYLWHFILNKNIGAAVDTYNKQFNDKLAAAGKFAWINPIATTQESLNDIAASGYRHHQLFREATTHYRDSLFNISNRFVFGEKKLTLADYKSYPAFDKNKFSSEPEKMDVNSFFILLSFSVLFMGVGVGMFTKREGK